MSIERQYGFVIICCDECGETFQLNKGDDFNKVWSEAKDNGWMARKVVRCGAEGWVHYCGQPCEPSDAQS